MFGVIPLFVSPEPIDGREPAPVQARLQVRGVAQSVSVRNLISSDRIYGWEAGQHANSGAQHRLAVAEDVPSDAQSED